MRFARCPAKKDGGRRRRRRRGKMRRKRKRECVCVCQLKETFYRKKRGGKSEV